MPRLRIAMIGTRGLPATHGGVEHAVEALALELAVRGHEVTVYGRRGYCDESWNRRQGVRQVALPTIRTKHLEAVVHTALATAHALVRGRYDVVHYHATGPALFAIFPRIFRRPTVATIHGLDYRREKWGPFASAVLRIAARLAVTVPSATIVVSRELQRGLREAYGAETTYITNGVDFEGLDGPTEAVPELEGHDYVLFLGRIVPEKQVHVLIEAFRRLPTHQRLAIVGPSLHADDYLRQVRAAAGRDPRILFLGPRYGAEKAWLLRNASVFVQPSTLEGLPIALLEALACGTQVLVSDIPENVEAITIDGISYGQTFGASDVNDLSESLERALTGETVSVSGAREATRTAFAWPRMTAETELVYLKVTKGA